MTEVNSPKATPPGEEAGTSLFEILTPLLHSWKAVVGCPLIAGIIVAGVTLLLHPTFTATTTFVPVAPATSATLPSGLASLAGEFGVNLGSTAAVSPDFFAEVLTSHELLSATLRSEFDDPRAHSVGRATLIEILEIKGKTPTELRENGIRELETDVTQRVDRRTGIVTLTVEGRSPALVAAVANHMVELLNTFNLERLQLQSHERRRFVGDRLQQADSELHSAETAHLRFLQANRRYADSPLLAFEENRLSRQVQLRQEVFQTLTREYEEARIAEVRDTPVLTVIDPAVPPDRRSAPRRKLLVFLALLTGALTALPWAYLSEYRRAANRETGSYGAFVRAWRDMRDEFAGILRLRKSPFGRRSKDAAREQ